MKPIKLTKRGHNRFRLNAYQTSSHSEKKGKRSSGMEILSVGYGDVDGESRIPVTSGRDTS